MSHKFLSCFVYVLGCCLTGCKSTQQAVSHSEQTEQATTKTDSIYITKVEKDSIYLHDSIYVMVKGDSVLTERWHTKFIERLSHDTIWAEHLFTDTLYKSKVDSVYVEKQLTAWQQFKVDAAGGLLFLALLGLITMGVYIKLKK